MPKTKENLICPGCKSDKVIPILYGYPTHEAFLSVEEGKLVLGGCEVSDEAPNWHCKECSKEWKD